MQRRVTFTRAGDITDSRPDKKPELLDSLNIFDLASLFLGQRKMIVTVMGIVLIVVATTLVLTPNRYQSVATILPSGGVDKMAGLKSLAGFDGLLTTDDNSSELYPAILRSRLIGDAILARNYSYSEGDEKIQRSLADYFGLKDHDKLLEALASITTITVDSKNGVIVLATETEFPELSQAITAGYLEELEGYNLHKRRSQAGERAVYLKRELGKTESELAQHEDSLEAFQSRNSDWARTTNPEILKNLGRLERELEVASAAFGFLRQEYEIARLDAQKDIQIVRVLDQPSFPTQKSGPKRLLTLALFGLVTFMLLAAWIILREYVRRRSIGEENEAYQEFLIGLDEAFPRLRRGRVRSGELVETE